MEYQKNESEVYKNSVGIDRKDIIKKRYINIIQNKLKNMQNMLKPAANLTDHELLQYVYQDKKDKASEGVYKEPSKENKVGNKEEADIDDDMVRLGKLSLINMGARYELLSANRMLIDLDVSLNVILLLIV